MKIRFVFNLIVLVVSMLAFGQTPKVLKASGTLMVPLSATNVSICTGGSGSLTASGTCNSSNPTTAGTNDAGSVGVAKGGGSNWSNTSRITANDNSYSSTDINKNNGISKDLEATNYGFSIPLNATILGVQVVIGRYGEDGSSLKDNIVQLLVGGNASGTNKASNSIWSTPKTAVNYGGTNDLWATTLTPSIVNASDFGVLLEVINTNASAKIQAYVDYMQISVTYYIAGSLDWYTVSSGGTSIASGTFFNPVGVVGSGLTDTNTPGTTTYYVECATNAGFRIPADFVINAIPSTPMVGTLTQPDCVSSTGSVVLSGLPASGTIIQTGTVNNSYSITGTTMTISGLASGTYNFKTSSGACSSVATGNVVISPVITNTWTTVWSHGTPNSTQKLVFSANYPPTIDPGVDINGCSCKVTAGANVIMKSGRTMTITNDVTVLGVLIFENNASLVQINNVAINSGAITYKRKTTSILNSDYTYWSSPVANQQLKNISTSYTSGIFYSYNDFAIPENWKLEAATAVMQIGKGYIIRGPQSVSLPSIYDASFVGVPNNGIKTIAIGPVETSNLIGNPYPSAINADLFVTANSAAIDGTLYFWTHNTGMVNGQYSDGDYASYNATGGVGVSGGVVPSGKIAAGQAFFTTSKATGTSVAFNNSMRVSGNNTQFFKTKNPKTKTSKAIERNRVWLNMSNTDGAFKQTLVGYISDATNEYDSNFDGESFDGNEFVDFYSVNQDMNLTIQGRALPFDENDEVPLGYRSAIIGSFTINIDQTDGQLTDQPVFLEDKLTNTIVDLKSENYTFTTTEGTFNERFVLKYKDSNAKTLATANFDTKANKVLVSIKNKQIKINSFAETIDKVIINDLLGRQIYTIDNVNSNELTIANLVSSRQVLIVKTTLQNGKTVTDKVVY